MHLYTQLNQVENETELSAFAEKLTDRFGPLPEESRDLLDSVKLKWLAKSIGLEKVVMKKGKLIGYFVSDQESAYYQSPQFTSILQYVKRNPGRVRLKEKKTAKGLRLLIVFENTNTILQAIENLQPLVPESEVAAHN